jgi:RNase adaptor protein for sRNA GlmZ degradation
MNQDWQTIHTHHKEEKQKTKKRVYVGNLIYVNDLPTQESLIRNLFASSAIPTDHIEIIPLKKPLGKCYALIECDVNNAIKCLNGVLFQGERIVVKAEQKHISNSQGKSSRRSNAMSSFGGGGWSQPIKDASKRQTVKSRNTNAISESSNESNPNGMIPSFQKLDIQNGIQNDDHIVVHHKDSFYNRKTQSLDSLMEKYGEYDPNYEKMKRQPIVSSHAKANLPTNSTSHDFYSKCKQPLSDLLQDYGEYDPDYEKMKQQQMIPSTQEDHSSSSSSSLSSSNIIDNKNNKTSSSQQQPQPQKEEHEGMLTTHGPIHIQIVSFGYKYGTPKQGYWSHSNPMSALDCRFLPRCHFSLAKFSGLHYKVKKSMTKRYSHNDHSEDKDPNGNDLDDNDGTKSDEQYLTTHHHQEKDNELVSKGKEVARNILSYVMDAIQDGGHGYAFPLEMTIYIGSEYGRHRSVVLVETIALQIRQLLRRNDGGRVTQPVSVSTRHRDVDLNHKDEEAYGKDLEREHKVEVRRKKKQEWLETSNQHDSYW